MHPKQFFYWQYPGFNQQIKPEYQLDLGQGNTPLEDLTKLLPANFPQTKLFLKREDQNPNGSFKDRALAYQISWLNQQGAKYCVLSSSGNAAISCCAFCQKTNIKPIILISPSISENKLSQIIKRQPYILIKSKHARRLAKYLHAQYHFPLLNPTVDKNASKGFETLGWELQQQLPNCNTIFAFSTSGASILGLINYYHHNNLHAPKIIAVRLSDSKIRKFYFHPKSKKIETAIKETSGQLTQISPQQAKLKQTLLQNHHVSSSIEGAACQAAIDQYLQTSPSISPENIVSIISGTEHRTEQNLPAINIYSAETRPETDSIITKYLN